MNVHVLYVLKDKTSTKNSVCLSVWLYVRGLSKELADQNKIGWVSSIYEM